jgi:hypothetical protein
MKRRVKKEQVAVLKLLAPDDVLFARLLTRVTIRSQFELGETTTKALLGAIRARQWSQVLELVDSIDTVDHVSVLGQYVRSQLVALVKKYPFTKAEVPGFDPEHAAWEKFQAAEHRCKRVNQRSTALRGGDGFAYWVDIPRMRRYIRQVLGVKPNINRIYDRCFFGPGASVGVSGDLTCFGRKLLADKWTCTRGALSYATMALWRHAQIREFLLTEADHELVCYDIEKFSHAVAGRVELVSHNNISFVPKSFKTHRSIATEPLLNGYVQKGIDEEMRHLLKVKAGLDLRDQEPNRNLAREGSLGGIDPYCTIDLSSASDSISTSVVRLLLPPDWYHLLDATRSHCYSYRGEVYPYHKFVSMGNGFCFPLQTLLFASFCSAAYKAVGIPEDFRVYGDDIIVRRSVAALVLEFLRYFGFRHNPDKTFLFGPFRESCGTDWYNGLDIRPVYLDYRLSDSTDAIKFHNATLATDFTYGLFPDVRKELIESCPEQVRFVRPYHGPQEGAFTVPHDTAMASKHVWFNRGTWALKWKEVLRLPIRDRLWGHDPTICNVLEYISVLRGSSSRTPFAVRRKTRAQVRHVSTWALPAELSWKGADEDRAREGPDF